MKLRTDKIKLTGWITHEILKKVVVFTRPKTKCVKVEIEIVPIKEKDERKSQD